MSSKIVYWTGGVSGLLLGVGYLIVIALYVPIGAPPAAVDALLPYLASHPIRWQWIIGLSVLTDFLLLPLAASIYFVLRNANRYLLALAAVCILLFVFLDLAITWPNYSVAMTLGREYSQAATEFERNAISLSAQPAAAVLHSPLLFVYNTLTLAVGMFLTGFLMLRSTFGPVTAYLGLTAGSAGILAVAGSFFTTALNRAVIVASALTTVWALVVGLQLCRARAAD